VCGQGRGHECWSTSAPHPEVHRGKTGSGSSAGDPMCALDCDLSGPPAATSSLRNAPPRLLSRASPIRRRRSEGDEFGSLAPTSSHQDDSALASEPGQFSRCLSLLLLQHPGLAEPTHCLSWDHALGGLRPPRCRPHVGLPGMRNPLDCPQAVPSRNCRLAAEFELGPLLTGVACAVTSQQLSSSC
jgi:hypothetical protein